MANYYHLSKILSIPLLITIILSSSINAHAHNNSDNHEHEDITIAMQDMQKSRHFTFVMLIKMVSTKIPPNTTLLMPNDRMLSTVSISETQILNFISQHSIPSPMNYKDLKNLPNGTIIPSSEKNYMLKTVKKDGKFYVNNAELVAPDICNQEGLFKCHGISTVLKKEVVIHRRSPVGCQIQSSPSISPIPNPSAEIARSPPALMPSMPPVSIVISPSPAMSPEDSDGGARKSDSSKLGFGGGFGCLLTVFSGFVFGIIM